MKHGNELLMPTKPLTDRDLWGVSRVARTRREEQRPPIGVFTFAHALHRRGRRVRPDEGYGTLIAVTRQKAIVRMPDGSVLLLGAGQFSVGG